LKNQQKRTPFPLEYERPNIQVNPPQIFEPRNNAIGTKKSELHKKHDKNPDGPQLGLCFFPLLNL
jgi:hypothetical protein